MNVWLTIQVLNHLEEVIRANINVTIAITLNEDDRPFYFNQSPKVNGSKSLTLFFEGNRIDELGYQIYKSHVANLDKIDKIMKIV